VGEDSPDVVAAGAQDGRRGILAGAFNGQLGKAAMDFHVSDLRFGHKSPDKGTRSLYVTRVYVGLYH
jgi:hypothetical protein